MKSSFYLLSVWGESAMKFAMKFLKNGEMVSLFNYGMRM